MSIRCMPDSGALWERHVVMVLRVLIGALQELRRGTDLPRDEEKLDRHLYLRAKDHYAALSPARRPQSFNLAAKGENVPQGDADLDEEYVQKRPDFKWRMQNDLAKTSSDLTMDFDVESKRLGKPTSANWVLNREYVTNGILRFVRTSHRYGNGVNAGAMIGYIQTMSPNEAHADVNRYIDEAREAMDQARETTPDLSQIPQDVTALDGVHAACQRLSRREFDESEFDLHHLWVDLRTNVGCTKAQ